MLKYFFLLVFFLVIDVQSQNVSGRAEYKASIDYKVYEEDLQDLIKEKPKFADLVRENLKATKDVFYELYFEGHTSRFVKIPTLQSDFNNGINHTEILAGTGEVYTSLNPRKIYSKNPHFTNLLIVEDPINWKLEDEEKVILGYSCNKAVGYRQIATSNGEKYLKITAWFTKEIPVPYGPKTFGGLPGLVVKLVDERGFTFELTDFSYVQSGEGIQIPGGELISNKEFQEKVAGIMDQNN